MRNGILFVYKILHFFVCYGNGQNAEHFVIEKYYWCKNLPEQDIKCYVRPKNFVSTEQVLDIHLITPMPLGNNIRLFVSVDLQIEVLGDQYWQPLISFDDDFCRVLQVYFGEMVYEVEQAMAIPKRACPIPKGNYHAVNYTINFARMKVQAFPFGKLRLTLRSVRKLDKKDVMCIVMVISNLE